jgi:hypothetical protein
MHNSTTAVSPVKIYLSGTQVAARVSPNLSSNRAPIGIAEHFILSAGRFYTQQNHDGRRNTVSKNSLNLTDRMNGGIIFSL